MRPRDSDVGCGEVAALVRSWSRRAEDGRSEVWRALTRKTPQGTRRTREYWTWNTCRAQDLTEGRPRGGELCSTWCPAIIHLCAGSASGSTEAVLDRSTLRAARCRTTERPRQNRPSFVPCTTRVAPGNLDLRHELAANLLYEAGLSDSRHPSLWQRENASTLSLARAENIYRPGQGARNRGPVIRMLRRH